MFSLSKCIHDIRVALTSEEELKYSKLANTADNAVEASKSTERLDKLAKRATKGSSTSKIISAFNKDIDDILA